MKVLTHTQKSSLTPALWSQAESDSVALSQMNNTESDWKPAHMLTLIDAL